MTDQLKKIVLKKSITFFAALALFALPVVVGVKLMVPDMDYRVSSLNLEKKNVPVCEMTCPCNNYEKDCMKENAGLCKNVELRKNVNGLPQ